MTWGCDKICALFYVTCLMIVSIFGIGLSLLDFLHRIYPDSLLSIVTLVFYTIWLILAVSVLIGIITKNTKLAKGPGVALGFFSTVGILVITALGKEVFGESYHSYYLESPYFAVLMVHLVVLFGSGFIYGVKECRKKTGHTQDLVHFHSPYETTANVVEETSVQTGPLGNLSILHKHRASVTSDPKIFI